MDNIPHRVAITIVTRKTPTYAPILTPVQWLSCINNIISTNVCEQCIPTRSALYTSMTDYKHCKVYLPYTSNTIIVA